MTFTLNLTLKNVALVVGGLAIGGGLLYGGALIGASKNAQKTEVETATTKAEEAKVETEAKTEPAKAPTTKTGTKTTTPTAKTAPTNTGTAPAPAANSGTGIDAQLRAMLTSSAWCSFYYSNGFERNNRAVFAANGQYSYSSSSSTYSSGSGGTYYGENPGDTTYGQWKVQSSKLYLANSDTGNQFVDVGAGLTFNSNGYPIITVDGTEFSKCN